MPVYHEDRLDGEVHGTGSNPGSNHREFYGTTDMISFRHHKYRKPPLYRSGGPWLLQSTRHTVGAADVLKKNAAGTNTLYQGTAVVLHYDSGFGTPSVASDASMDSKGATAMARSLPTNPNATVSTTIAELFREGIPSALGFQSWKTQTGRAKAAGGEYLNVEFGWKPLLADVRKFGDSVKRADQIWDEHLRNASKDIHRSYDSPVVKTTDVVNGTAVGVPTMAGMFWAGSTTVTRVTREWSEFAFRYYVPMGDDFKSQTKRALAKANKLYGTNVTPEVLWNLTPWSWGLDWVGNTGDVLRNMSALSSDTLVLLYGYSMRSDVITRQTVGTSNSVPGKTYVSKLTTVQTVKQRRPANPYGFGVAGLALSPSRAAIVAALAAARGKSGSKYND